MVIVDGGGLKSGETLSTDESGKTSVEIVANVEGQKSEEMESDEDKNDSASDSDSSSSSSSSFSSSSEAEDDNEEEEEESEEEERGEKELEGEIDMEEGEIRDSDVEKMVAWSDEDEDGGDGSIAKGPIRSENELQVLPPVPPVYVTLQPHHQTLPVGVILSILGPQVIVEGLEKHNPLNEGSVLWITESRTPLGLVDEIFGPVKNPYYMIRYNSENEIPDGVKQGTPISFVPEFADHVLNDSNLYKKGYDASGENDEEIADEFEFSDDEKEAKYKRMQKMTERRHKWP
ncbi:H/ACA ribonucleoprotein complex non-core subunit NAF1-like [Actinidia eriantha]|uniref:H/ACA ribonucleoprotein complex non-core subunit NAF1-like n=1 Tax=Actinidia eriantha TaxID=165200 RepID=UPI0025875751|nr:H/ACA ribonucleoprotein complex non-core subunit NAF1-like [Actinidia eriantha]